MKKIILTSVLILSVCISHAQGGNRYFSFFPKGFQLEDVNGETVPMIENDFDGDGVTDLAAILFSKADGTPIFCYYLSSIFDKTKTFKFCDWVYMRHSLDFVDEILTLSSGNGSMPIYGDMGLKYDATLGDLKIVSYEDSGKNNSTKFNVYKVD
jgi:hypothetical protein